MHGATMKIFNHIAVFHLVTDSWFTARYFYVLPVTVTWSQLPGTYYL